MTKEEKLYLSEYIISIHDILKKRGGAPIVAVFRVSFPLLHRTRLISLGWTSPEGIHQDIVTCWESVLGPPSFRPVAEPSVGTGQSFPNPLHTRARVESHL